MSSAIPPTSTRTTYIKSYTTPFKRHLAFYDLDKDGVIWFHECLQGSLSLGLNFPVAVLMACGIQTWYGTRRPWFMGPLRGVEISKVQEERFMLEGLEARGAEGGGVLRKELISYAKDQRRSIMDRAHVWGIWALSANDKGMMSAEDVMLCQEGMVLPSLAQRREKRENVIPFLRGGPISVGGHAWFVEKLFGVRVYQDFDGGKKR